MLSVNHWLGGFHGAISQAGFQLKDQGPHTTHVLHQGKRVATLQNTNRGGFDVEGIAHAGLHSLLKKLGGKSQGGSAEGGMHVKQYSEGEGVEQGTVQFYEHSTHYHALKKAGFKFQSADVGGWRPTFEHPETGEEATIHFDHSNSNGRLEASPSVKRKLKKHYDSQHSEEVETPDWEAIVAAGPLGTQRW